MREKRRDARRVPKLKGDSKSKEITLQREVVTLYVTCYRGKLHHFVPRPSPPRFINSWAHRCYINMDSLESLWILTRLRRYTADRCGGMSISAAGDVIRSNARDYAAY